MALEKGFWSELERAIEIAAHHRQRLLALPGVVAVGAGAKRIKGKVSGRAAIIITVERKLSRRQLKALGREPLAALLDGVAVDVVAQAASVEPTTDAKAMARVAQVKDAIAAEWLALPNVTALGVGYKEVGGEETDTIAIRIYVARKMAVDEVLKRGWPPVPATLGGIPTDVIELPPMKAAAKPSGNRNHRKDPLVGGIAIGTANRPLGFGTLGAIVFDRSTGESRILTNQHVLDGKMGEKVIQPSSGSIQVGFQLDICNPAHFWRVDTPNTILGSVLAGAAVVAVIAAALSDEIDPTRRGQEATTPATGALTTRERQSVTMNYPEMPIAGLPFKVGTAWRYDRDTTAGTLSHEVEEQRTNPHVLLFKALRTDKRRYRPGETIQLVAAIMAPRRGRKRVCSNYHCVAFLTPNEEDRLFPVVLREAGTNRDAALSLFLRAAPETGETNDLPVRLREEACFYVGSFTAGEGVPAGPWRDYLYVQTVNSVPDGIPPAIAAQTIGGMPVSQNSKAVMDVSCGPVTYEDGEFDIELI